MGSFKTSFFSAIVLFVSFVRDLSLSAPFIFGLFSLFIFVRLFIMLMKNKDELNSIKQIRLFSSYVIGFTLLAFHLNITSYSLNNLNKFEFIDEIIETYFNARKEIINRTDILEKRKKIYDEHKQVKQTKNRYQALLKRTDVYLLQKKSNLVYPPIEPYLSEKVFSRGKSEFEKYLSEDELNENIFKNFTAWDSLKIVERGLEKKYRVSQINEYFYLRFCHRMAEIIVYKTLFGDDQIVLNDYLVNRYKDSFQNICSRDFSLPKMIHRDLVGEMNLLVAYIDRVSITIPKIKSYYKQIEFKKNHSLRLFYFDELEVDPFESCVYNALYSDKMIANSYQISSAKGLFSSLATESELEKVGQVTFYSSPFEGYRYFCVLAKQKINNDFWTNIWVGEVL